MNLNYKELLPQDFAPNSKVWIYQASRLLTMQEAFDAEEKMEKFVEEWASHGADVKAAGFLFFGRFLILMADETQVTVGGCSTDSSQRFVKLLEKTYQVDFFNRTNLAFLIKDKVELLPYSQVQYGIENNFITPDTIYFNNLVSTKKALEENWLAPVKNSWLAQKVKLESN